MKNEKTLGVPTAHTGPTIDDTFRNDILSTGSRHS